MLKQGRDILTFSKTTSSNILTFLSSITTTTFTLFTRLSFILTRQWEKHSFDAIMPKGNATLSYQHSLLSELFVLCNLYAEVDYVGENVLANSVIPLVVALSSLLEVLLAKC